MSLSGSEEIIISRKEREEFFKQRIYFTSQNNCGKTHLVKVVDFRSRTQSSSPVQVHHLYKANVTTGSAVQCT